MHLAEDNDVVQALTSDRSDQPFYTAVETGRTASSAAPLAPADRDRTYKMVAPGGLVIDLERLVSALRAQFPERKAVARSLRQLRRFLHLLNAEKVFGTRSFQDRMLQRRRSMDNLPHATVSEFTLLSA
jgi:hypothetical protein